MHFSSLLFYSFGEAYTKFERSLKYVLSPIVSYVLQLLPKIGNLALLQFH